MPDLPPPPPAEQLLANRPPYWFFAPEGADDGGVPDGGLPDGGQGWPALVVLHGFGATGDATQAFLQLDTERVLSRYVVAVARGLPTLAGGIGWNPTAGLEEAPYDSLYLQALIADVKRRAAVDPRRVFVVGHSQGGHMAYRLACDDPEHVAAVVGVAGQLLECRRLSRPVSGLAIHGTADTTIRYFREGADPGAADTVGVLARADGCTGGLVDAGMSYNLLGGSTPETTVQAFTGCPAGVDVELATVAGGDHRPRWVGDLAGVITGFCDAHGR